MLDPVRLRAVFNQHRQPKRCRVAPGGRTSFEVALRRRHGVPCLAMARSSIGRRILGAQQELTGRAPSVAQQTRLARVDSSIATTAEGLSSIGRRISRTAGALLGRQSTHFATESEEEIDVLGTAEELAHIRAKQAAGSRLAPWQTTTPIYPPTGTTTFIRQGYHPNSVVRSCVDIRGRTFSQGILEVYDRETSAPVEDHPITALLRAPTNVRGTQDRWCRTLQDLDLNGNAIWEKVRARGSEQIVELWRLDPQRVRIELSEKEWIKSYWYEVSGIWFPIPARNIIHWMYPDPDRETWFGIPPILSAWRAVSVDNLLVDQLQITLQNKAVPSVVLEAPEGVTVDDTLATEARRMWHKRYGGRNLGDVAVTDMKVKVIGMTWKDMDLSEVIAVPESRIASVYGIPMILVGRSNASGDTGLSASSTYKEAKLHFWFDTVIPLHTDIAELIEIFLLPEFGGWEGLGVRFNTTRVRILQMALLEIADKAKGLFDSRLASRHAAQRMGGMALHGPDFFKADAFNEAIPADAEVEGPVSEDF